MRIKDTTMSSYSTKDILTMLLLFVVSGSIGLCFCYLLFNTGLTLAENLTLMRTVWFDGSYCVTIFFCIFFGLFPFIFLWGTIQSIKEYYFYSTLEQKYNYLIKHIDFKNNNLIITYFATGKTKKFRYDEIDFFELIIKISSSGRSSRINNMRINFQIGEEHFSLSNIKFNFDTVYKILDYSRFMQDFSCNITGNSARLKSLLTKIFTSYINNNYKKTLLTYLYSTPNWGILALLFVIFVSFIIYLIL